MSRNREIYDGKLMDYVNGRDLNCLECYRRVEIEVHNPGEINMEYWIGSCECGQYKIQAKIFEVKMDFPYGHKVAK